VAGSWGNKAQQPRLRCADVDETFMRGRARYRRGVWGNRACS